MWPRTDEERARGRNTGFVCFMTREDAQDAIDAYGESDPLNTGRRMMLRWGKNVKKTVKRGTGGVPIAPIRRRAAKVAASSTTTAIASTSNNNNGKDGSTASSATTTTTTNSSKSSKQQSQNNISADEGNGYSSSVALSSASTKQPLPNQNQNQTDTFVRTAQPHQTICSNDNNNSKAPEFVPVRDLPTSINVIVPKDPTRLKFVTTVASFVAKDGSVLERKIMDRESNNAEFAFLFPPEHEMLGMPCNTETIQDERIFYRWRVYTFAQGDMNNAWRTEPFQMFRGGKWWIPPPLVDREAAKLEEDRLQKREEDILQKKEERKKETIKAQTNNNILTGRQLEHVKFGVSNVVKLTAYEKEQFSTLLRRLCASRESICEAMVFCFEKSGSAVEISDILLDSLLDVRASVDTRVARLYLLSDVLFNSQQPGVRNAFRYRDAVEQMAPQVFGSMGKEQQAKLNLNLGRMSMNKLRRAIQRVLGAWAHWSVYTQDFMEELESRFEGSYSDSTSTEDVAEIEIDLDGEALAEDEVTVTTMTAAATTTRRKPIGGWKVVDSNASSFAAAAVTASSLSLSFEDTGDLDGEPLVEGDVDVPLSKFFEMYGMVY